ncbi:B-cell receptor CD22-like [Tachysurus fulvidraco]|uniref:B-cell receptor CD22-like n=1 Tax=Tachysurus fulvidraco TaxID=1234273 RepID=UPI001FEE5231|nr:B-cell receptor CD22-like [Tachysurus fulvidraco]
MDGSVGFLQVSPQSQALLHTPIMTEKSDMVRKQKNALKRMDTLAWRSGKNGNHLCGGGLQPEIAPAEVIEGQSVVLTCKTTCNLTEPTFIWYKNSRDLTTKAKKNNEVRLQSVSFEDAGSYSCAVRGYEHLHSPVQTLRVRYPPKNVSVSISPSGEIMEGSSVNLTCSSDANPPVQNYTWFKVKESSPVGSGQSYRAVQSGQYYCEAQNKHGSERSAAVSVTINGTVIVIVYVAVELGLFGLAALLSALFWLRSKRQKKKKADEGDSQNTGSIAKDDIYQNLEMSQISHPSPHADMPTSSDYGNIAIMNRELLTEVGNSATSGT